MSRASDTLPRAGALGPHTSASATGLRALAAAALLLLAFAIDIASGNEVSSSLFYVPGIALAAWLLGERSAYVCAIASAAAWAIAVRIVGPGSLRPGVFGWNIAAELLVYLLLAGALANIRRSSERHRTMAEAIAKAHAALDREAKALGDLQREMLPEALPELPGYRIETEYRTSTHAGGDYYDLFTVPDGRVAVIVGDASGHGPQAAVLMAMLRVLLRAWHEPLASAAHTLSRLNRQLAHTVPPGRFVTACLLVLDPASGRAEFSLAGHPAPLLLRASGMRLESLPLCGGPPLGAFSRAAFESGTFFLRPGDALVLYTDGLTEGMDRAQEMFGEERLRAAVREPLAEGRDGLFRHVLARFDAHAAGAPLADDLTLLVLRRDA